MPARLLCHRPSPSRPPPFDLCKPTGTVVSQKSSVHARLVAVLRTSALFRATAPFPAKASCATMSLPPQNASRTDDSHGSDHSPASEGEGRDHGDEAVQPTATVAAAAAAAAAAPAANANVPKPKRLACMICRKRKLKCDGIKPSCSTCARLGHSCAYDEVRRKSGPKRGYVKALEERLSKQHRIAFSHTHIFIYKHTHTPSLLSLLFPHSTWAHEASALRQYVSV